MNFANSETNDTARKLVLAFLAEVAAIDPGTAKGPEGHATLHASTAVQLLVEGLMLQHADQPIALLQGIGVGIGIDLAKFENAAAAQHACTIISTGLQHGFKVGTAALAPQGSA